MEKRIKKKDFDADDLDTITDRKRMCFPQYYEGSVGFAYTLPLAMWFYMPFVIAGYQTLIGKGEKPT